VRATLSNPTNTEQRGDRQLTPFQHNFSLPQVYVIEAYTAEHPWSRSIDAWVQPRVVNTPKSIWFLSAFDPSIQAWATVSSLNTSIQQLQGVPERGLRFATLNTSDSQLSRDYIMRDWA
jgi:hypothetical protein